MGLLRGIRARAPKRGPGVGGASATGPVVRNAARFMAGDIVDRLLGLAFLAAALRLYGVADYGTYVVGLTVFQVVRTVVGFGLGRSIMKETAAGTAIGDPGRIKGAIALGLALSVTFASLAAVVLVFGASRIAAGVFPAQTGVSSTLAIFGALTPLYAVNFVLLQSFYGLERIRDMVLANSVIEPVARLVVLVAFFVAGTSGPVALPGAYFAALVASTFFASAVFVTRVWPELAIVRARCDLRETLAFAFPVMLTDLFSRGLRSFNTFLFAVFRTAPEVGLFDIALKLAGVVFFFSSALVTAFRPRIAALLAEGRLADLSRETQAYTRWILSFAILPFGLLILFPEAILGVVGPEYLAAASGVRILSCGLLVAQSAGPLAALLLMSGRSKQVLYAVAGAAGTYTAASCYAIPAYGIDGAATAATGTILVAVPILSVYVQRTVGIRTRGRSIWKPIAAALVAFPAAVVVSMVLPYGGMLSLAAVAATAATLYLTILVALGIEPHDRALLSSFARVLQRKLRLPEARRGNGREGHRRSAKDQNRERSERPAVQ